MMRCQLPAMSTSIERGIARGKYACRRRLANDAIGMVSIHPLIKSSKSVSLSRSVYGISIVKAHALYNQGNYGLLQKEGGGQ